VIRLKMAKKHVLNKELGQFIEARRREDEIADEPKKKEKTPEQKEDEPLPQHVEEKLKKDPTSVVIIDTVPRFFEKIFMTVIKPAKALTTLLSKGPHHVKQHIKQKAVQKRMQEKEEEITKEQIDAVIATHGIKKEETARKIPPKLEKLRRIDKKMFWENKEPKDKDEHSEPDEKEELPSKEEPVQKPAADSFDDIEGSVDELEKEYKSLEKESKKGIFGKFFN